MGNRKNTYELLFEDDHILIVSKAAHLLSIPDRFKPEKPNLYHMLNEVYGKVYIVHRLDKETSGILCFAKTEEAHRSLSMQFENRSTTKTYLALCEGTPIQAEGSIELALAPHPTIAGKMITTNKGKSALTTYKVIENFKAFSLIETHIHTGRTHQIRVHFQAIGHPLAVDPVYNKRTALFLSEFKRKRFNMGKEKEERPLMARSSLHAWKLSIQHPHTKEEISTEAPLPKDFRATLNQLRKWNTL